jgi:hypothetical protein
MIVVRFMKRTYRIMQQTGRETPCENSHHVLMSAPRRGRIMVDMHATHARIAIGAAAALVAVAVLWLMPQAVSVGARTPVEPIELRPVASPSPTAADTERPVRSTDRPTPSEDGRGDHRGDDRADVAGPSSAGAAGGGGAGASDGDDDDGRDDDGDGDDSGGSGDGASGGRGSSGGADDGGDDDGDDRGDDD